MRPSILLSFHFWRKADLAAVLEPFPERPLVFADSGAFSADSVGASIDIDEYAAWLDRWSDWIDIACTLDVIGNADATWENTQRLEGHGATVIPVFHVGEPWEALERLCENYAYIGVGGMVPWAMQPKAVLRWLIRCFATAERTGTVIHGLGQTNPRTLADLPFYSVDSSAWVSGERYGALMLWDDQRARLVSVHPGRDARRARELGRLIRDHGITTDEVCDPAFARPTTDKTPRQVGAERQRVRQANLQAWTRLAAWWRERHGPIPCHGLPDGPHVFLVCAGPEQVAGVCQLARSLEPAA